MSEIHNQLRVEAVPDSTKRDDGAVSIEELSQIINARFSAAYAPHNFTMSVIDALDYFQNYLGAILSDGRKVLQHAPGLGFQTEKGEIWEVSELLERASQTAQAIEQVIFDPKTEPRDKVLGFTARQVLEQYQNALTQFELDSLSYSEAGMLLSISSDVHMTLMKVRLESELGMLAQEPNAG